MKNAVDFTYYIRQASINDCPQIRSMALQVWEPTYGKILSSEQLDFMFDWMYSIESLENQMKSGHIFFIASKDNTPVAYMSVEKENANRYHLQKIYILPSEQGKGLGNLLIGHIERYICKKEQKKDIILALNVNRNNSACYFYEKNGFEVESEGDFDIGHGFYMNDYIMVKKIKRKL